MADQRQIITFQAEAYNAHDVEEYASYFHADIEVYNYPDSPITTGHGSLITTTKSTFADRSPKTEIINTIEINNKVIAHEMASFVVKGYRQSIPVVKIYEFKNGLIRRMTFLN
ncbi:nuclear transport factor 2 family protein [Gilvimarinus sp. 1_MG-2023]|uniref:nuclear transport factor 2 family protein n=1 Tax=Gilvimarinus sp. 1_MG-2023 TaxID=3062638 RepID=UPI0026E467C9|nr:nuclear transport factor 2 family protein [Gilvimarinus sp. 1_MG-2023]MDO6747987.1 nuclear transport factor 2 family protein [Gilvimarinus sp. 1_MG-2023]